MNSEKNKHRKATYGPLLMEHVSRGLTDTVTRSPRLELFAKWQNCGLEASATRVHRRTRRRTLLSQDPRGQLEDEFGGVENHRSLLFMHVGLCRIHFYLPLGGNFTFEWEGVEVKNNKNTLH